MRRLLRHYPCAPPRARPDTVSEIVELYHRFETVDGISRAVDVDEVINREHSLDISRYMQQTIDVMPTVHVMEELQALKENVARGHITSTI